MGRKGFSRLLQLLLVTWGTVTIVFFVGRFLPADPAVVLSGPNATPQMVASTRMTLGLDKPLPVQYWLYMQALFHGDLGRSAMTGRPVISDLAARFPASLELVVAALSTAVLFSFTLGALAGSRPNGVVSQAGGALAAFGTSVPTFFLGLILLFLFYILVPVAPAPLGRLAVGLQPPPHLTGLLVIDAVVARKWDVLVSALHHLMLPAITLAVAIFPQLFRVFRSSVMATLRSDALAAIKLSSMPRLLVWRRYIIPPALAPVLSLLAASFGYLIGGTVLVEHIFGWNGLGAYVLEGVQAGDYAVVQGVVLVSALAYGIAFLATDLVQIWVDPRLREGDNRVLPR